MSEKKEYFELSREEFFEKLVEGLDGYKYVQENGRIDEEQFYMI